MALIGFSAPAFATGGFQCKPISGAGPVVDIVTGSGVGPGIIGVTLHERNRVLTTPHRSGDLPLVIAQSWIDRDRLRLDLTDANAMRYEAKLRTAFDAKLRGRPATGTLTRGGRTYKVRCIEA